MNRDQFRAAVPGLSMTVANKGYGPVENSMFEFAIVSPQRAAAFLATVGHESAGFTRLAENLNYSAEGLLSTFGSKYYTAAEEPAVPKFQQQGQALRAWRSLIWAAGYAILDQFEKGERPVPTDAELLAELPILELTPDA